MDTLWDDIEKLSAVCRAAGAHLPDEELKSLQVGKVAEEAGEAMHALHGLKGLTICGDDHAWPEVQNDLVGAVITALLAMHYIDPRAPAPSSRRSSTGGRAGDGRRLRPDFSCTSTGDQALRRISHRSTWTQVTQQRDYRYAVRASSWQKQWQRSPLRTMAQSDAEFSCSESGRPSHRLPRSRPKMAPVTVQRVSVEPSRPGLRMAARHQGFPQHTEVGLHDACSRDYSPARATRPVSDTMAAWPARSSGSEPSCRLAALLGNEAAHRLLSRAGWCAVRAAPEVCGFLSAPDRHGWRSAVGYARVLSLCPTHPWSGKPDANADETSADPAERGPVTETTNTFFIPSTRHRSVLWPPCCTERPGIAGPLTCRHPDGRPLGGHPRSYGGAVGSYLGARGALRCRQRPRRAAVQCPAHPGGVVPGAGSAQRIRRTSDSGCGQPAVPAREPQAGDKGVASRGPHHGGHRPWLRILRARVEWWKRKWSRGGSLPLGAAPHGGGRQPRCCPARTRTHGGRGTRDGPGRRASGRHATEARGPCRTEGSGRNLVDRGDAAVVGDRIAPSCEPPGVWAPPIRTVGPGNATTHAGRTAVGPG